MTLTLVLGVGYWLRHRKSGLALEVLRTIHSFDPCIACAIHLTDTESNTAISVKAA